MFKTNFNCIHFYFTGPSDLYIEWTTRYMARSSRSHTTATRVDKATGSTAL